MSLFWFVEDDIELIFEKGDGMQIYIHCFIYFNSIIAIPKIWLLFQIPANRKYVSFFMLI